MKVLYSVGKAYLPVYKSVVSRIKALGAEVECLMYDEAKNKKNIIKTIKDADIYITAVASADAEVIDAAPKLKYIIKTGTGVDNIDVQYSTKKGILVSNAPGQNAEGVAELAIGFMISLSREITKLDRATKADKWEPSTGLECRGKTLGIIGFGSIGKSVAKYAAAFQMKVIAFSHHKDYDAADKLGVIFTELDKLLSDADYVLVSTSLKKSNYHLIDKKALHKMKRTAFLINVSRGAIVDSRVLMKLLKERRIAGAALDVFENEPPKDGEIPSLDNLIVTPHVGGTTLESANRIAEVTVDNIRRFIQDEPLLYVLNQQKKVGASEKG
ncbi:glycerate dehydrogenase [Sporolactobacillus sp. THM7-4]|nr:glycerate dehydrogenase [Sporolactobacillus sp. THM7-4]